MHHPSDPFVHEISNGGGVVRRQSRQHLAHQHSSADQSILSALEAGGRWQWCVDVQFEGRGIMAWANSGADTNGSQVRIHVYRHVYGHVRRRYKRLADEQQASSPCQTLRILTFR